MVTVMGKGSISSLDELFAAARVSRDAWDIILIGDGSGSLPETPGGWACAMITKDENGELKYEMLAGALTHCAINRLECLPYAHALQHHYHYRDGRALAKARPLITHIFSDSEWAVKAMGGRWSAKIHADLAQTFQFFQKRGYDLRWRHFCRDVISLNTVADWIAVNAREYISGIEAPDLATLFPQHVPN